MNYNIELSVNEEKILFDLLVADSNKRSNTPSYAFIRAKEAYKDFDFSQLSKFDKYGADALKLKFAEDFDLNLRPLLQVMYIFHRNGFLDENYFKNSERVFDLTEKKNLPKFLQIPEGLITESGMLYGTGKDGHIWLFNFLNLSGINTTNVVRYSAFSKSLQGEEGSKENIRSQFFSKLKEFSGDANIRLYISINQAKAMNNLRKLYNPEIPLQNFLLNKTADLGFKAGDSAVLFKNNFDTFYEGLPEEPLDKSEMLSTIRMAKHAAH